MTAPESGARRVTRSRRDRVIGGVAGGLGNYFGIDPVLVRLAFVALALAGVGVLFYLIAWLVIPLESPDEAERVPERRAAVQGDGGHRARMVIGVVLIAVGVLLLVQWAVDWLDEIIWPLLIIGLGVGVFAYGTRRD